MSDERAAMDQVGRYWDAVAQGDGAPGPPLDPALARTIQRVHGLGAEPSAEARERVWRSVLANAEAARRQEEESPLHALVPNGRAFDTPIVGQPGAPPRGRQRWFLTQLATAALILLTLVGSFMVLGPGLVSRQEAPAVFIPAIEATPATPEAEAAPVVEFLWSAEGGPDTPLGDPYFLTLGPDGNLWIPDGLNGRFQIFSPEGEFIESWGTPGNGEGEFDFRDSGYGFGAVAFAEDGSFYVADMGNDRVQKFGPDRTYLASWGGEGDGDGQFRAPLGIAIDNQDRIYVTDTDRNDVQVFDRDGAFLAKWGGFGSNDGQLRDPHAVSIDSDGNVWVADFANGRIQQFSPDGTFLKAWNGADQGGKRFIQPANIRFDQAGRVHVVEWSGNRVQVFASDGEYVASWGVYGRGEGEFRGPLGMAFGGDGVVFVSEDGNDRVQAFRLLPPLGPGEVAAAGTPEAEAPIAEFLWAAEGSPELAFREPNHPVIGPDGNIWLPDGWNNRIAIFAPDGTWLEDWGTEGSGDGEFLFENGGIGFGGVAFDAGGNIYVADSGNRRVQKFGPDRAFLSAWGSVGNGDGQFMQPVALAVDGQGRVYVSDRWGSIEVFDGDGRWLASWDGLGSPVGITVDLDGNVWVADEGQTEVIKFSPDGERLLTWDAFGFDAGAFSQPSGVDVDAEGRLFVSDRNNRVQIFSPDGDYLGSWGSFGLEPGKINGPYGIAVSDDGIAYTGEDYGRRLQAFRLLPPFGPEASIADSAATPVVAATPAAGSSAVAELVWETRGGPGMPLSYPGYLALDPAGNLWVPDSGNDRYQIFSADGQFVEAWGETGSGEGQFEFERELFHSSSIAFAADGSFYVTDGGNFRVQKFGPDRAFVTAWGEQGAGPGQFDLMNGIAVDGQGRVYVTDDGRSDVQVFDADGAYLMTIGERGFNAGQFLFTTGSAVAIDAAGNVWVSDSSNGRIQTFSPDGEFLSMLAGGPREDQLQQPNQLAIDGEGRIFVASPDLRQVQVFANDGTYLGAIGTANPTAWAEGEIPSGEFLVPTGVALDGDGNIYVADYEDYRVQKFRLLPPLAT